VEHLSACDTWTHLPLAYDAIGAKSPPLKPTVGKPGKVFHPNIEQNEIGGKRCRGWCKRWIWLVGTVD